MLCRLVCAVVLTSAWGLQSPHQKAFLSTHVAPEEEMGPQLNFSPMSTTMQCILSLTLQYFVIYTALGITRTVLDFQQIAHDSSGLQKALNTRRRRCSTPRWCA